jgi:cytochrome P450
MATPSILPPTPAGAPVIPRYVARGVPAVPGLPLLGNLLAFRRDRLALHARAAALGPIARVAIGPIPAYVVTCADLAHDVLVAEAASYRKSPGLGFLRPLLGTGLLTAEGEPHRRHRKLLAPVFAPRRLAAWGEIMVDETVRQLAGWRPGARVDLAAQMMEMTLAIAGRTLFGVDVRGDAATVARGLELAMHSMTDQQTSPIRLGERWPLPRHLRMRRAVRMLDDVVYRLIAAGRARAGERDDFLSLLIAARDDEDGTALTDLQIRDEVMTLLLAGHETTANALTWAWYELARHPDALARLVAEIAAVAGDRPLTTADLPALAQTAAVVDEAMRLHPPAYVVARESLREVTLGGHTLPERSIVVINIHGIHRRADYFPEPAAFRPDRMLADARKLRPRHHFLPFGAGPRVCIGQHFALIEAQLALATMVRHAAVRLVHHDVAPEPLVTLRPRGGMPVVIERAIA